MPLVDVTQLLAGRGLTVEVASDGRWVVVVRAVVQVDPLLIVAASALGEQHSLSFWDALIIEAARRAGANRLVSEDLQHGRRIAGLVIANPFLPTTRSRSKSRAQ